MPGAGEVGNILIGAGTLTIDQVGLGYTRGGVSFGVDVDIHVVEDLDQVVGGVKARKVNEVYTISTELVELSIENIKTAWGIDSAIDLATQGHKKLPFGGSFNVPEHKLTFYGEAPNGKKRTVTFHKVISVDYGEQSYVKDDESVIPVTFRALLDLSKEEGKQIGEFDDEVD